jgi:CRP-like cAMP-binding protein
LSAGARASADSQVVKIDAQALHTLFEKDFQLGYLAMQQVTKALMERLAFTRVQLAAAWA